MHRAVSIRRRLIGDIVVLVAVLTVTILLTVAFSSRLVARRLSSAMISRSIEQATVKVEAFFDPVLTGLRVARAWGEQGLLDTDDPDVLVPLFEPVARRSPQLSSLMVADDRGREFMLLQLPDKWMTRQTRRDEWNGRVRVREWTDTDPTPVVEERELDYDPRGRPWFQGAMERRADAEAGDHVGPTSLVHCTEPYKFFTTKQAGITASTTFRRPDGTIGVIGYDMLLEDLSDYTASIDITPGAKLMVLTTDRHVIGLPDDPRFAELDDRNAALLKRPEELGFRVANDAVDAVRAAGQEPERVLEAPIRFDSEGESWWAMARTFLLTSDRAFVIVVLVPEDDLLVGVHALRIGLLGFLGVIFVVAVWRSVALAGRFSHPIEVLVAQSDRISHGDLDDAPPIGTDVAEVLKLAEAQDRMRVGLRSLMKLERDLQVARQIQQNTFPKTLPVVPGFELIAWNDPADETGGDTYDVIGHSLDDVPVVRDDAEAALLLVADATGHGIGPALAAAEIRAMLRMAVRHGADLASIAVHLNEQLHADLPTGRFITAWLGALRGDDHTLTCFSAGQAPLLHYHAAEDRVEVHDADQVPLGIVPELDVDLPPPITLQPGDIYAVISDGIFEAMAPDDSQFGTDRVVEVLRANRARSPADILAALREAVDAFTRSAPASDDRTVVLIKRTARARGASPRTRPPPRVASAP